MKIEVGKYYRTRDGRKVGPIIMSDWRGIAKDIDGELWNFSDGTHGDRDDDYPCIKNIPELDLIAEWDEDDAPEDEPNTFFGIRADKFTDDEIAEIGRKVAEEVSRRLVGK